MKILMLIEYFHPFASGGSEWSVYHLIRGLQERNSIFSILTPNYGTEGEEIWNGVKIRRFPFFPRARHVSAYTVSPFWHSNIVWYAFSVLFLLWECIREKPSVLHVQSNSFIPAAVFIKWILKIPIVVTLRDYAVLCPYGYCLQEKRNYRRCSLLYHMFYELPYYYRHYVEGKSVSRFIFQCIASAHALFIAAFLRFFLKFVDDVICISSKQKHIFDSNNIEITDVIYNIMPFQKEKKKKKLRGKVVTFIGRITYGKGADIFVAAVKKLLKKRKGLTFELIGEGFLKNTLKRSLSKIENSSIHFVGQLSYTETLNRIQKSIGIIVPSRWEEPFGRVALESLACGVPVIVTNRGGLPEIVTESVYGYVVEPQVGPVVAAVEKLLKNQITLKKAISCAQKKLKKKFYREPISQYKNLYMSYVAKD